MARMFDWATFVALHYCHPAPLRKGPNILLGIGVVSVLGSGPVSVAYALAFATVPTFARLMRARVLTEREREYVVAARCIGARSGRIMWLHVLRNAAIPIITHLMAELPGLLLGAFLIERFFSIPGIGREVIPQALNVLRAVGGCTLEELPWGADYYLKTGVTIPPALKARSRLASTCPSGSRPGGRAGRGQASTGG